MIDRETGALVLSGGRLDPGLTRSRLLALTLARGAKIDDMGSGWMHVDLGRHELGGRTLIVSASFEGERLDGYTLCDADPRFGTSWDGASERKELARRRAHDKWLEAALGAGGKRDPEISWALPWGEAWSRYDARSGVATIGVRFRRR